MSETICSKNRITKTFCFLAKLLYIGIAIQTTKLEAQVHQVGFLNVSVHPGLNLVGLQLDRLDRSISTLFQGLADGTTIYQIVQGDFTSNVYQNGQWERPDETVAVGEGVFVRNPASENEIITFVGEMLQGDLTNSIPAGLSLRCSIIPKAGKLTSDLGLRLSPFDNVYMLANGALKVFTYLPDGTWKPAEPNLLSGESFMINAAQPTNWVTHFEVNVPGLEK